MSHSYPDAAGGATPVLSEVTVRFDEHRVGVIGANGSGKSTFARMLNGLVMPTRGQVLVDGRDTGRQAREIRRRVGFCFTDPSAQILMPTVREDLAFSLRGRGLDRQEIRDRVTETLARFGLDALREQPAHKLSGGQRQLLALAAVLITEPELVVMDEPTTLLDLANAVHVRRLVSGLAAQVVLVTHQLDLLDDVDRVLVFHEGRLVFDGDPAPAVAHYRGLVVT